MLFNKDNSFSPSLKPMILRHITGSLAIASALSLGLASAMPAAAADKDGRPPFPLLKFSGKARSAEALRRLGKKLPEVAAWYRMTPEKLTSIMEQDSNAWLDEEGRVMFIDEFPEPPETMEGISTTTSVGAAPYPLDTTFSLHSKPGSQRVLYLDFTGHTMSGSAWSSGTIVADAFDLDGIPSSFSTTEQERIQYIWQRVAEDYAPFDVDVTTEEPAADLLNRTSSSDQLYGARVLITRNNFGVCTNCGGMAYVGVFSYFSSTNPAFYQPALVFFDMLGSGNEKYVAEAISHEAGHNLGLSHDGSSTVSYYEGHGSGATGWAPIMGVGYYQELVQWSKGEYPDANNTEDDVSVIQTNGALLKTDDVGSTLASAVPLGGNANGGLVTVGQKGVIETNADIDYFSFTSGAGPLQIAINPDTRSPNLDLSVQLLDSTGLTIASSNPADALTASINANVSGGNYYLKVDGTGKGNLTTGYSDYGSLGQYSLSGSYTDSNAIAPVAVASATPTSGNAPLNVFFSSDGSSDADGTIVDYYWDFGDGSDSTEPNPSHVYNSAGTFNSALTVTDSQGLKNTDTVTINVSQPPLTNTLHIDSIAMTSRLVSGGRFQCVAKVTVKTSSGGFSRGAKVNGKWSGITTSNTLNATTNTRGLATFTSPPTRAHGTCTFTVNGVALSGWTYDASQNAETSDSLTY
jgi:PKD repeat protein